MYRCSWFWFESVMLVMMIRNQFLVCSCEKVVELCLFRSSIVGKPVLFFSDGCKHQLVRAYLILSSYQWSEWSEMSAALASFFVKTFDEWIMIEWNTFLIVIVNSFVMRTLFRGALIIMLLQNVQNLDPHPPCSHSLNFGSPLPPSNIQILTSTPPPTAFTTHPQKQQKILWFYSFIACCNQPLYIPHVLHPCKKCSLNVPQVHLNTNGVNY